MLNTVGDLIDFSLRTSGILGVGQTAQAEDSYTGLDWLRTIMGQWKRKRWLVYVQQTVGVDVSTGAQSYTIGGTGCDFDAGGRVDHITAAVCRILGTQPPNLVDLPLEIIMAHEDWARISVKTLETLPAYVFLDTGYPTGRVWFWPVPPAGMYGLYLICKAPLPTYVALTDPINLPDEYLEALIWSLCVRLQMSYGLSARPDHVAALNQAMNTLRMANAQIAMLEIPAPLGRVRNDLSLVGRGLGRAFTLDQGAVLG